MSAPLLLAEELFLLAHDDESGKSHNTMGLSKQHKKQAEARAKEIADAGAVGSAVTAAFSQSVQAVQLAVVTAVIVPTVVTSS
jgi:hypothetical protein